MLNPNSLTHTLCLVFFYFYFSLALFLFGANIQFCVGNKHFSLVSRTGRRERKGFVVLFARPRRGAVGIRTRTKPRLESTKYLSNKIYKSSGGFWSLFCVHIESENMCATPLKMYISSFECACGLDRMYNLTHSRLALNGKCLYSSRGLETI